MNEIYSGTNLPRIYCECGYAFRVDLDRYTFGYEVGFHSAIHPDDHDISTGMGSRDYLQKLHPEWRKLKRVRG